MEFESNTARIGGWAPGRRCLALLAVIVSLTALRARAQSGSDTATLDLMGHYPAAAVSADAASLGEIPVDADEYFTGGWYQASTAPSGTVYRWLGPRAGAIDVSMVEPEELALELGMVAAGGEGVPAFNLRLYWNGEYIGGAVLGEGRQIVKATVPATATRVGRNRLEIIPSFWVNASRLAGGASASNVSVNLFRARIAGNSGTPRPRPVSTPRLTVSQIEQPANTIISFFEAVPRGARLSAAGHWSGTAVGVDAEALLVASPRSGGTHELARFTSSSPAGASVDVALPPSGDDETTFTEISLVVRQHGEVRSPEASFTWGKLSLMLPEPENGKVEAPRPKPAARPNVVLYVIDTLRASHLEPYGATHVSTPRFTALARDGTTFARARAHTSWTRPSVATLLTSLYENSHGTTTIEHKLARAVPYLPEILRAAGYRTAGVSMNGHIAAQWGFDRGFDTFTSVSPERAELLSPPEPEKYIDKLWERYIAPGIAREEGPFFLYLHELDPHGPYTPPPPFDGMYPSHYRGQPEVEAAHIALVRTGLTELEPQDIAYLESRYRGEVSFVDAVLGAFRDRLEREGLADDTILIVVSDHGEEFGEHGGIGHSVTLYEEMLRVPMMWAWPGRVKAGNRPDAMVGLIDVVPTLLSVLRIEAPDGAQGRDVSALLFDAGPMPAPRPIFSHKTDEQVGRALQAAQLGPWKLIERMFGPMSSFELYNLEEDPREVTNRWIGEPLVGGALKQALAVQRLGASAAAAETVKLEALDPEMVERLKNLGYVQ